MSYTTGFESSTRRQLHKTAAEAADGWIRAAFLRLTYQIFHIERLICLHTIKNT